MSDYIAQQELTNDAVLARIRKHCELIRLCVDGTDGGELEFIIEDLQVIHRLRTFEPDGYVYILRAGDYVKIGRSKSPDARTTRLAIQLPFPVEVEAVIPCESMVAAERRFHEIFAEYRTNGEWFLMPKADFSECVLYVTEAVTLDPRGKAPVILHIPDAGEYPLWEVTE